MTEILTEQTPPILQGPSDKEKKYDRQLRLWAASGQAALEEANILLLNSGAGTVGVETLKNLVLPGVYRSLRICTLADIIRHWTVYDRRRSDSQRSGFGSKLLP